MIGLLNASGSAFLEGAVLTLVVSISAILLGLLPGILMAAGHLSKNMFVRSMCAVYRSVWRGTPILVQLLLVFYLLPGLGITLPPTLAAIATLALNTIAFQSEIYRAGLQAIPAGHLEAAEMLGFSRLRIFTGIQAPQAIRLMLPALVTEAIIIVKNSALVSVISVTELTRVGQQIASATYRPLECYLVCGIIYLLINAVISQFGMFAERRFSLNGGVSL